MVSAHESAEGMRALLKSPRMETPKKICVAFFFNLYVSHIINSVNGNHNNSSKALLTAISTCTVNSADKQFTKTRIQVCLHSRFFQTKQKVLPSGAFQYFVITISEFRRMKSINFLFLFQHFLEQRFSE
jgi:hypothetical protein